MILTTDVPKLYPWTPELRQQVLDCWKDGLSGGQIAKLLPGKVSTSAVVALVNREGQRVALENGGVNPYRRESPVSPNKWPKAMLDKAVGLWKRGLSAAQIGKEMGASRNAIIGQINRAGKAKARTNGGTNPYFRPVATRVQQAPRPRKAAKVDKPKQVHREVDFSALTPGERLPPLVKLDSRLWVPLAGSKPKSLIDLNRRECRWSVSDTEHLFCALPTDEGCSWCSTHSKWATVKQEPLRLSMKKLAA